MKIRSRGFVILCGVVPTLVAAALSLHRPPSIARTEWRLYDTIIRAAGRHPPGNRIIIVDVDERSLTAIGQWPWRRDLVGRLIGNLRDLEASTVALDIVFAESDRLGETGLDPDAALADTLRGGRVVLGYALTFDHSGGSPRECVHHPLGLAVLRNEDESAYDPFFRATSAVCNIQGLAQAATTSGFLNAAPDADGILRRVPLIAELGGRIYPSLALAAVSAATGSRGVVLRVANVNASTLAISRDPLSGIAGAVPPLPQDFNVPLDGKSNLLLRYRGVKRTFPYVSAVDVLDRRVDPHRFKDKIVFVGTSALGTREVVSTPLDTLFTGVEVQATVADNLLQRDFLHRTPNATVVEALVALGLGLVVTLLTARFGLATGGGAVVACLVAVWTVAIASLSQNGAFLSPLFPSMSLCSSFMFMIGCKAVMERIRADDADRDKTITRRVMIQALLSLVEIRDAETGRHSRRTQEYTRVLALELALHPDYRSDLSPEQIDLVSTLAPLHDIGKVGVPDRLLHKPGELTAEELREMRKHPVHGHDIILKTEREVGVHDDLTLSIAKDIVYTHHEKWDGTGYPRGLRGSEIPIAGRLVAVVDVYDAAHSRRVYQPSLQHSDAVALIVKGSGTHFDPAVVSAFVKVSPIFQQLSEPSDR